MAVLLILEDILLLITEACEFATFDSNVYYTDILN
jgi:hypothetical protein